MSPYTVLAWGYAKSMIEPSKISMGRLLWRGQESVYALGENGARTPSRQELSFLSLRGATNGYPDTGESGEAYDSEASANR